MNPMTRLVAVGLTLIAVSTGATQSAPVPDSPPPRGPAEYGQARGSLDNLKRIGAAYYNYEEEHGHFPRDITDKDGKPLLSWRVAILPYLDQDYFYSQFKLTESWDGPNNRKLLAFMPGVFRAAVQSRKATDTYYQAIVGPGTVFEPGKKIGLMDIADGTSNTLLLVEAGPPVPWTKPADIRYDPTGKLPELTGPYTDAVHVAVADGSTFRMKPKPGADVFRAFLTRAGEEVFDTDMMKELRAAPAKPVTAAEKKQLAERQKYAKKEWERARDEADQRYQLEQELRKLGGIPYPDPATIGTFEELEQIYDEIQKRMWADMDEAERLDKELRKKNTKVAERIEQEFRKRWFERVKKEEGAAK